MLGGAGESDTKAIAATIGPSQRSESASSISKRSTLSCVTIVTRAGGCGGWADGDGWDGCVVAAEGAHHVEGFCTKDSHEELQVIVAPRRKK